jgi:hypothetical protein
LYNWWQAQEGKLEYLNKFRFKLPFLVQIYNNMVYQMENLALDDLRLMAEYYILKAEAAIKQDSMIDFEANVLKVQLEEKKEDRKDVTLNEFIDYIELTLNCPGTIDPEKTSASRAYSLHNRAKERNKSLLASKINKNGKYH